MTDDHQGSFIDPVRERRDALRAEVTEMNERALTTQRRMTTKHQSNVDPLTLLMARLEYLIEQAFPSHDDDLPRDPADMPTSMERLEFEKGWLITLNGMLDDAWKTLEAGRAPHQQPRLHVARDMPNGS